LQKPFIFLSFLFSPFPSFLSFSLINLYASYWFGWGAPSNCADAVFLLKTVAERGPWGRVLRDAYSLYKAGHRRKALLLYLRAAEAGYEIAQNNVAYMLRKRMVPLGWDQGTAAATGMGVEDEDKGAHGVGGCADGVGESFLERAVMQGSSEAAVTLGELFHERGNTSRAVHFFQVAISQGDVVYMPRAAISLGRMYEHGDGVEVDKEKAKALYRFARRAGGEGEVAGLAAETMMEVSESVSDVIDGVSSTLASLSSWFSSWF
jgi:SEL1 protein